MIFDKRDSYEKEGLKEAFAKVKNDIFSLGDEISSLKLDFIELKNQLNSLNETINSLKLDILDIKTSSFSKKIENIPTDTPTVTFKNTSNTAIPTDTPTVPVEIEGLKYPNFRVSSGNRGVPADRQTNQQTDIYVEEMPYNPTNNPNLTHTKPFNRHIEDASEILNSLDVLKKEIRLKFKQMTNQEMLVFSTIYQLEEQFPEGLEYRQIASKLKLSESSIRDYTQKLILKGIPVDKIKLNNKKILLKISSKLKNLASLETIMKLREL